MNTAWIKNIADLPEPMKKDLQKQNKYNANYYGVLGVVIGDSLKVNDIFFTEKVQIGIPYEFVVIGIYGSRENNNNDPNTLSLLAKTGTTVIVIAEARNITTNKHKQDVELAKIQRDASYYGPLNFRNPDPNERYGM